jgi:hypothetical protein
MRWGFLCPFYSSNFLLVGFGTEVGTHLGTSHIGCPRRNVNDDVPRHAMLKLWVPAWQSLQRERAYCIASQVLWVLAGKGSQ